MSTTQQSLEREPDAEGLAELGAAAKRIQSAVEQVIEAVREMWLTVDRDLRC